MSETLEIREQLVQIALRDRGKTETTHNQGEWIKKYWPQTSYPEGYENEEPYCAAAMCYWVWEWVNLPDTQAALEMDDEVVENWRPKSAAVFDWEDWAVDKGVPILDRDVVLHTGDVMIFDCSHIGVVWTDKGDNILTVEANTGPEGEREGDGCYVKLRTRYEARSFLRLLA